MTRPRQDPGPWAGLAGSLGLLGVLLWLVVVALRLGHPFELEWQEGGMLAHSARVRAGQPLFVEPGASFCPFPYPPLFPWLGALAEGVLGPGFAALRAVSVVASLGILVLLGWALRARGTAPAGIAAALGVLGLGHAYAGAWLDVARPDALAWCLGLASTLALLRGCDGARPAGSGAEPPSTTARGSWTALAAVLLVLAFLAKQTAVLPPLCAAAALWLAPATRRRSLGFALLGFLGLLLVLGVAELRTGRWFRFHVFELLAGHATHWSGGREYLFLHLPWLLPALLLLRRATRVGGPGTLGALLGGHLAALVGSLHVGAFENVLLPGLVAAAATVGLALGSRGPDVAGSGVDDPRGVRALPRAVALLALLQLGLLLHDPRPLVPTAADRAAGERVVARLRELRQDPVRGGALWIPAQGYLAERAGDPPQLHWMTFLDLSASDAGLPYAEALVAGWDARLRSGAYAAALVGAWQGDADGALRSFLEGHLHLEERLFGEDDGRTFVPVTGAPRRPELVYRP